jgi:hypothetical protein
MPGCIKAGNDIRAPGGAAGRLKRRSRRQRGQPSRCLRPRGSNKKSDYKPPPGRAAGPRPPYPPLIGKGRGVLGQRHQTRNKSKETVSIRLDFSCLSKGSEVSSMSKFNEASVTRCGCSSKHVSAPHAVGQPGHSGALLRQLAGRPAGVSTLPESITETARPRRRKHLPQGYLVASQVAEITRSPPSSIYAAIKSGRLRAARWKNQIVVAVEDAQDYASVKPLHPGAIDAEARHG